MQPLVSVIIPKRRGEDIHRILASVNNSTYKNIETIVVDEGLERSAQRNIGMKRARGKYFLILDSDQLVSPGLIRECVELCTFCGGIYIPEIITTPGLFAYIRNWERQFYTGTPIDVVRFVRAAFCPKFDEDMTGPEDSDWDRRVPGYKWLATQPIYHEDNVGLLDYFKKKAYYAKSMKRFAERNLDDSTLNWRWRCLGVFVEKGKWKRLLRRPDLALAVFAIIFIRGVIYLCQR